MFKSKLDNKSEQNIINMLLDSSQINNSQFSKINSTSQEGGRTPPSVPRPWKLWRCRVGPFPKLISL